MGIETGGGTVSEHDNNTTSTAGDRALRRPRLLLYSFNITRWHGSAIVF